MIFETHTPDPSIAPYIESIFHYQGLVPDHSVERVVPTGHLFILFELDGFVRNTFDNRTLEPTGEFTKVWVSGMHRQPISISAHEDAQMLVVQFKPFGSYPFTHTITDTLNDRVIPADELFGLELSDLRGKMMDTEKTSAKFALIERWLLDRFDTQKLPPEELIEFVKMLQHKPVTKLKTLIEKYPTTQKNLITQFRKYMGLTPKGYQRVVRFNGLLQRIKKEEVLSWADVAYDCGYSDQSHFIREFQHFSGMNPAQFLTRELNDQEPNFFPLVDKSKVPDTTG